MLEQLNQQYQGIEQHLQQGYEQLVLSESSIEGQATYNNSLLEDSDSRQTNKHLLNSTNKNSEPTPVETTEIEEPVSDIE